MTEREIKLQKLATFLDRHKLDGVMLWSRANFAWMTGGRDNHIIRSSAIGVAGLMVTPEQIICVCNIIESARMRSEELAGLDIEVIDYPWHDDQAARSTIKNLIGSKKIATDFDAFDLDLPTLSTDFSKLRWQLCPEEIERYRIGGRLASDAMESACRKIHPGMTEKEIAGVLDDEIHKRGAHPVVTLVGADDRLMRFRHPIPTSNRFENVAMLVTCSEYKGLISNLTRFVHVGKMDEKTRSRVQAVADIDATINLATKPDKSLHKLFEIVKQKYEQVGFANEWKFHHQGGVTGYAAREMIASPESKENVQSNQAFAWNPSVPGCKSEDTVLIHEDRIEVLTAHSSSWPSVISKSSDGEMRRAGWLELQ